MDYLTLRFPASGHFNQSASQLEGNVLLLISPTVSASRMSFVGTFPWLLWPYKMQQLSSCFEPAFVDIPELYPKSVF